MRIWIDGRANPGMNLSHCGICHPIITGLQEQGSSSMPHTELPRRKVLALAWESVQLTLRQESFQARSNPQEVDIERSEKQSNFWESCSQSMLSSSTKASWMHVSAKKTNGIALKVTHEAASCNAPRWLSSLYISELASVCSVRIRNKQTHVCIKRTQGEMPDSSSL